MKIVKYFLEENKKDWYLLTLTISHKGIFISSIYIPPNKPIYAPNKTNGKYRKRCGSCNGQSNYKLNLITQIFPDVEYHPDQISRT